MPARHFYLLLHYICYSLFFLFSVFWLHVNEFNSLWEEEGERSEGCVTQKVCLLGIFTCSHITFVIVYSFLLGPKHRKKKQYPVPDAASERVYDADEHLKHSDYRADGTGYCFFFRLFSLTKYQLYKMFKRNLFYFYSFYFAVCPISLSFSNLFVGAYFYKVFLFRC